MDNFFTDIRDNAPQVLLALAVLVIGWILARILSKAFFMVLARSSLEDWASNKLGVKTGGRYGHRIERILARSLFFTLVVVLVILVLYILPFEAVDELVLDVVDELGGSLADIMLAVIIISIAFLIGKLLGLGLTRLLQTLRFDERMKRIGGLDIEDTNLSRAVGAMVFWFVLAIGVIQGLDALALESVVEPLQAALEELVAIIPNIVGAALILAVGIIVARFVGKVCANLLHEAGFNRLAKRVGLVRNAPVVSDEMRSETAADTEKEEVGQEEIAKTEAALEETTPTDTDPQTASAPPEKDVSTEESDSAVEDEEHSGETTDADDVQNQESKRPRRTPSELAGLTIAVVVTLLVASEALSILHLTKLAFLLEQFINYLPNVGIAFIILVAGTWAGKWVRERVDDRFVAREEQLQRFLGLTCQTGILIFAAAMALQQLGVASDLILTAFAILFGAMCLALSLAFGLGGREVAGDVVKTRYTSFLKREAKRAKSTKARKKPDRATSSTKKSA